LLKEHWMHVWNKDNDFLSYFLMNVNSKLIFKTNSKSFPHMSHVIWMRSQDAWDTGDSFPMRHWVSVGSLVSPEGRFILQTTDWNTDTLHKTGLKSFPLLSVEFLFLSSLEFNCIASADSFSYLRTLTLTSPLSISSNRNYSF
jgi:hypothetical protein